MSATVYLLVPALFCQSPDDVKSQPRDLPAVGEVESFQWKSRVLLVRSAREDARLLEFARMWSGTKNLLGAEERHLLLLWAPAEGAGDFGISLIGKDGGMKNEWKEPASPADVFSLIDAMPMRREEMREESVR